MLTFLCNSKDDNRPGEMFHVIIYPGIDLFKADMGLLGNIMSLLSCPV